MRIQVGAKFWAGCLTVFVSQILASGLIAEEPDYVKQIKPLLQRKCASCHGALQQKGEVRLDHPSFLTAERDSGPSVVPGKPDESLLLLAVLGQDGVSRMPQEGEPLSAEEVDLLRQWILAGAKMPATEPLPTDPRQHWSFKAPQRPQVPTNVPPQFQVNPIDAFLAAKQLEHGVTPRPEADQATLLRRLYIDLIGIPPTRAELASFLADTRPAAYVETVDRLLAMPQYGERWGRHWMDVWRYSDWDGFGAEVRESQPHLWRWREWIIESLNKDAPYDQMVRDMVAGDELAPGDQNTLRATGFLARNWFVFSRQAWLDSSIEHTGKAFLGLTFNCARCHDHMFDPVSQQEYYQLRAIFEPHEVRADRLPGEPDLTKAGLARVYDAKAETPTYLLERGEEKQPRKDQPLSPLPPAIWGTEGFQVQPVALPPQVYYPGLQAFVREETLATALAEVTRTEAAVQAVRGEIAQAEQRLELFLKQPANETPSETPPLLQDDFLTLRSDQWDVKSGTWTVANGHVSQTTPGGTESLLLHKTKLPRDVVIRFRYKITGGDMWRSLGLSFDAATPDNYTGVYLSAYSGGPKIQLFLKQNGQLSYPAEATRPFAAELNQEHELYVAVQDQLVNVGVDGQLRFAYRLPTPRAAENWLGLWTYDATGELLALSVEPLAPGQTLLEKVDGESTAPVIVRPTEESLRQGIDVANRKLPALELAARIARKIHSVWEQRIAADTAVYAQPPAANATELAQAAVRAERELDVLKATAEQAAAAAEHAQAQAALKPDDEKLKAAAEAAQKKLAAADEKLATLQKGLEQPLHENYTRLTALYPTQSTGRRAALAQWLTAPSNPLLARVAVNHIWLRHFQKPLVPTMFDFGLNGKPATHPELLDWLATELVANGWQMKAMHRLMVTSQAYRRASTLAGPEDALLQLDPDNVWYTRANSRRMESEVVRDSTLAVCGSLDLTMGGPDLDPATGPSVPRRSVYFRNSKEKKDLFLSLFDSPNVVECYQRAETIVPQQALAMSNSPLTLAQARKLAGNLSQEVGPQAESTPQFIEQAFLLLMSRSPTAGEQAACQKFLTQQTERFSDPQQLTAFSSPVVAAIPPATDPVQRSRENLIHVLLNHNDFVTVR